MPKKNPEKLKKVFEPFTGQHPVYERLDHYESNVKSILKGKGEPTDLAELMSFKRPSKAVKNLRSVLWAAERVRECIKKQDSEGSARFMFKLAVAVMDADLSLRPTGRKGKDRTWLEAAINEAVEARQTQVCAKLWRYFKVKHNGTKKALKLEGPAYGSVYFQNESLIFDDSDKLDPITYPTFQKKLTELKKNPAY